MEEGLEAEAVRGASGDGGACRRTRRQVRQLQPLAQLVCVGSLADAGSAEQQQTTTTTPHADDDDGDERVRSTKVIGLYCR